MPHKVITPVATEPVIRAEARLQCKVDSDDLTHDALLDGIITTAREYAEHYAGRAMAAQTLEMALAEFPDVITLELPPVASVTSITYVDTDGVVQTLAADQYIHSTYGASREITPAYAATWPATRAQADAVKVRYVTAATCPKAAKQAMLIHIEMESPLNPLSPSEREAMGKARDSLLDTCKVYG